LEAAPSEACLDEEGATDCSETPSPGPDVKEEKGGDDEEEDDDDRPNRGCGTIIFHSADSFAPFNPSSSSYRVEFLRPICKETPRWGDNADTTNADKAPV